MNLIRNEFIQNIKYKTTYAIKSFHQNPLDSLGVLIPIAAGMVAFIGFIVAYILFIVNGGYATQIDLIKSNGVDGISQGFTTGTTNIIYGNIVGSIIKMALGIEFVILMITYFSRESNIKKILMVIDLVSLVTFFGITVWFCVVYMGGIAIVDIAEALDYIGIPAFKTIFKIMVALTIIAVVLFIVLTLMSKSRWMVGYGVYAALISFVFLPLVLLLLENIIPLLAGIVALAVLGIVVYIIFGIFLEPSEPSKEVADTSDAHSTKKNKETEDKKQKISETKKNCEYIDRGFLAFKVYKVHGVLHDYVERDNGIATGEICSLEALRKGRFHIYDKATGKEIFEYEIPWKN